jgi:hypothetical protein
MKRPSPQCRETTCQGEWSQNSSEEEVRTVSGVDQPESETRLASATEVIQPQARKHRVSETTLLP